MFPETFDELSLNTAQHESGICISNDGNMLVFSRADFTQGQRLVNKLYFSKKKMERGAVRK